MKVEFRKGDVVFCDLLGMELTVTGVAPYIARDWNDKAASLLDVVYSFEEIDTSLSQSDLRLVEKHFNLDENEIKESKVKRFDAWIDKEYESKSVNLRLTDEGTKIDTR